MDRLVKSSDVSVRRERKKGDNGDERSCFNGERTGCHRSLSQAVKVKMSEMLFCSGHCLSILRAGSWHQVVRGADKKGYG